jgi:pentatricopeptide repeat protein
MENVFGRLTQNPKVAVQGAHWASLINAYGCVQKDLDKAIAIFDSIETHPRTPSSPTPLPDAVTYEAMINVLVAHRRTDLIPKFILRLQSSKIHLTAYIANIMIKGFATVGDLAKAREVFEELHDPPEGIAAPNNHAPHEGSQSQPPNASAAVYREVKLSLPWFLIFTNRWVST